MKLVTTLILSFLTMSSIICQIDSEAKEFEENEITSELVQFNYKAKKTSLVILIMKNENYDINSYDEKVLIVFNKDSEETKEYSLSGICFCVLEGAQNEKEPEYIFKFENYKGGSFIVYSSVNSFPLKYLEKGFNLHYYFSSGKRNNNLNFFTEFLKENVLLDIYPGDNMKIKKISQTGSEEIFPIKNNFIELAKDYKYTFEYSLYSNQIEIAFKKREIFYYNKNDEIKINFYNLVPYFVLIEPLKYNYDIIYSYLYYYDQISYDIGVTEIESEKIDNWDDIEFINNTRRTTNKVYEISTKNVTKTYLLIKLKVVRYILKENDDYFYIFKIFQNYLTNLDPLISQEEILIIQDWRNKMIFLNSNTSNLRTFGKNESSSLIYQRESYYFPFMVEPTEEPYILKNYSLNYNIDKNLNSEIFLGEKSFRNYLSMLFDSVIKQRLWYFDIKDDYTFFVKSYFGSPKMYYSDIINQEIIDDIEQKKFEKVKEYKLNFDIIKFNSPFFLYIDPYENSYLNFILNKNDNLIIMKEISNKYLIKSKEYYLKVECKIMVRMEGSFGNANINVIQDGKIISTLNPMNPYIKIDESYKDLTFKSDGDSLINIFYHFTNIFYGEPAAIINFPIDKKGQIMIVKVLSHKSNPYYYAMNYGYEGYISPDTKKISTTQRVFYIDDPYTILSIPSENLIYYLILFGQDINYEISYIKKYEKNKDTFYYKITGVDNYGIISDLNYPSGYYTYEILLCENEDVNITLSDIYSTTQNLATNTTIINYSDKKVLFTFQSKSDFIFIQKENEGNAIRNPEIKFYIPKIEGNKISIVISNNNFDLNTEYSLVLLENNNKDETLINQLDNECFFFSLINNEIKDIKYDTYYFIKEGRYLYEEIDISKYPNTKNFLIKIYSCKNEKEICVFSKTKIIYMDNLEKHEENEEEIGITKIEEFTEYKVTRDEYMFSYDYKNYLNTLEDMFIYISSPTRVLDKHYTGELEVINPLFESFTFKYRFTETISLIKDKHIVSNGKYYFIFRNCSDVTFYLHNTLHFFPLNKINNYITESDYKTSYGDGLLYFTMDIEEDKYIYLEWNTGQLYLYSILDKTTEKKSSEFYNAFFIKKGNYLLILEYGKNYLGYHFSFNINHYLINIEKNKEIKVDMGIQNINQPTTVAVFDLTKYTNQLYLVSDSKYANIITCEKSMDIKDIIENGRYGGLNLNTHIAKIDEMNKDKCEPPYYNIKLYNTKFEVISEVYTINTTQSLTFRQKDTIAFTVNGKGFHLVFSDQTNIKWLDKMQNEYFNYILSDEIIQFKLKPIEDKDTNLRIVILDNEYNISINILTNNEITKRIRYDDDKKEIKYYINLSKNKYLINHFDYLGKIEFYISKEEINEKMIEELLKTGDINPNIFNYITQNTFEIDSNKILAIKKEKTIFSELLITPLIHDFTLGHTNSKYISSNRKYYFISSVKILLEENSDAIITIYDFDDTVIYTLDKNNPTFENEIYNRSLYLKSNKDTLIYIYHHIKENSKNFIKEKKDDIFIILSSDCRDSSLNYCFDNGFINYIPNESNLTRLTFSQMFIHSFNNNSIVIQKGTDYILYMECERDFKNNISDFYENSTINEGSYIIDKNIYLNSIIKKDKKNIFYQIYECNDNNSYNFSYNEFYVAIDEMIPENLIINNSSFINGERQIEFYLKAKNECIFNYYKTGANEEDYHNIEKNENPHFNISYLSRNEIKVDILPLYKNIDFEYNFFIYLDRDKKTNSNSLSNKCYMKRLITQNNDDLYINDVIIKKIEYKNGTFNGTNIKIPDLETNLIIHANILGKGKILEDIEEYAFYEEKIHKIEDSDFPSEPDEKPENEGLNIWIIIGSIIGVITIIIVIVVVVGCIKRKKKDMIDLESDIRNHSLVRDNENTNKFSEN